MTDDTGNSGPVTIENPDLLVAIFDQMAADREFTTNALIDGYRDSYYTADATVAAIRWRIEALLEGDYMPSPRALLSALYPSEEVIEAFKRAGGIR